MIIISACTSPAIPSITNRIEELNPGMEEALEVDTNQQPAQQGSSPFPFYGAYLVEGNEFVELFKTLGEPDFQAIFGQLLITNSMPRITLWYPDIQLSHLALMRMDVRQNIPYRSAPSNLVADALEIEPEIYLVDGVYCLLQGGPLANPVDVPFWCFKVSDSNLQSNLPVTPTPGKTPVANPTVLPFKDDTPSRYIIQEIEWNPTNSYLALAINYQGEAYIIVNDTSNGQQPITRELKEDAFVQQVAWSPDGTLLAYHDGLDSIVLLDVANNQNLWETNIYELRRIGTAGDLVWDSSTNQLVYGDGDNIVFLDHESGEIVDEIDFLRGVQRIVFSPDGKKFVVSASAGNIDGNYIDDNIWLFDLGNKNLISSFDLGSSNSKTGWNPAGTKFAMKYDPPGGGKNPTLYIYDGNLNNLLLTIENVDDGAINWSPDGNYISVGTLNGVPGIYDANNGQMVASFPDFRYSEDLLWSPDGQYIMARRSDGLFVFQVEGLLP